jgi:sirohydrochlorin cobaltochelatase
MPLADLEATLKLILPEEYQDCYDDVQPTPMGSAALRFGPDGRVAWNELWATFCDLAMAGGPPHKGRLLQPATRAAIDAQPDRHAAVIGEICRGIGMVTDLLAFPSPEPGWVRVSCDSVGMAGWLVRAIVMENVAASMDGDALDLPAGPDYRLEKEIKNVVTVMAKTCHYWAGHMGRSQQRAVSALFAAQAQESPLLQPDWFEADDEDYRIRVTAALRNASPLPVSPLRYQGWIGVECPRVQSAIWMMRALVVENLVARREETVLFVPLNRSHDPQGDRVANALTRVHHLAAERGVV